MILLIILIIYFKDCREIGKENLAVPLAERVTVYLIFVVLPVVLTILIYRL